MPMNLIVSKIDASSQAEKSGIRVGDTLVSYDGRTLQTYADLQAAIEAAKQANKFMVDVIINRAGKPLQQQVTTDPLGVECSDQEPSVLTMAQSPASTRTDYGTARGIAGFVGLIGWLLVAGGAIAALFAVGTAMDNRYGSISLIAVLPALSAVISGLLLVMGAQMTRAVVDTADHAREIRSLLERR